MLNSLTPQNYNAPAYNTGFKGKVDCSPAAAKKIRNLRLYNYSQLEKTLTDSKFNIDIDVDRVTVWTKPGVIKSSSANVINIPNSNTPYGSIYFKTSKPNSRQVNYDFYGSKGIHFNTLTMLDNLTNAIAKYEGK